MILPMENTEKMIFPGVGKYGIPEIKPETDIRIDKLEWIPFNYKIYLKANGIYDVTWYPNFCPVCGRNLLKYRDHPEDDPRFAEQTLWMEHDLAMDE